MSAPSLIQDLAKLGAGVFVTARGVDTRLGDADFWRAYEEPVIIWAHGETCDDDGLERVLELVRKIPHIQRFRFTSSRVTRSGVRKIYEIWPDISVDGVVA
jgi:hypothetical protein